MGRDDYVKKIVNGFMPEVKRYAYKIYGRKECLSSHKLHGYYKASKHIREECDQDLILIGVDDRIEENMDEGYDLKIAIKPYNEVNAEDQGFLEVIDEIVQFLLRNNIKIDYYSHVKTAFHDPQDER